MLPSCVLCHSNDNSVLATSQNALQAAGETAFSLPFTALLVGKVSVEISAIVVKERGKRVVPCFAVSVSSCSKLSEDGRASHSAHQDGPKWEASSTSDVVTVICL